MSKNSVPSRTTENKVEIITEQNQYPADSTNMTNAEEEKNASSSTTLVKTFNKENAPTTTIVSSDILLQNQQGQCTKTDNID